MRKFTLAIFIILVTFNSFGQASRFPINPKGVWNIKYVMSDYNDGHAEGDEYYKYYIESDTTINNVKYYKLYKDGVAYYDEPFYYTKVYSGALRDENNKFYFVAKDASSEKMLIDFDLKVGNEITAEIGKGFTVKRIDTLLDGRKKIFAGPEFSAGCTPIPELIEGIGHTGGIMEDAPCNHPGFRINTLTCYLVVGEIIYKDQNTSKSECDSGTSIPEKKHISFKISPIPATSTIKIEAENALNEANISLYNLEGRLVFSQNLKGQNNEVSVNISSLKKGMYMLKINSARYTSENYKIVKE